MLIACPAERLGVEIPKGGIDAISAEDVQRDTYAMTRPGEDPGAVFGRRLAQMHLPPPLEGAGRVCGRRGGEGADRVIVAPWPTDVASAAQAAALISLAKGWDGQAPPARTTWLCVAKADAVLPDGERVPVGVTIVAQDLEAIDYRRMRDDVRVWFRALNP